MNRRRMLRSVMACLLAVVVTAGSVPTELFTANAYAAALEEDDILAVSEESLSDAVTENAGAEALAEEAGSEVLAEETQAEAIVEEAEADVIIGEPKADVAVKRSTAYAADTADVIVEDVAAEGADLLADSSSGSSGTGNALKAIGIDTDKMPEGYDDEDDYSNPYGAQNMIWNSSDEVYVASMGKAGSAIIGNNVSTPVKGDITYKGSDVKGTTSDAVNAAPLQNKFMNKTAGGNFDGNGEGKKPQFAMVSVDDENDKMYLSVVDANNEHESRSKELGWKVSAEMAEKGAFLDKKTRNQIQAIAYMCIKTGDFDGNGIDEIAVFNPNRGGTGEVEIYGLKFPPDKCDIYDMSNWEIRRAITTPGDNFVSMDAGDLNGDGVDELVIGCDTEATVYEGSRSRMLDKSTKLGLDYTYSSSSYSAICNLDPSVVIYKEKATDNKTNTYIGVVALANHYRDGSDSSGCQYKFQYDPNTYKYSKLQETYTGQRSFCLSRKAIAHPATQYTAFYWTFETPQYLRMPYDVQYLNGQFVSPRADRNSYVTFTDPVKKLNLGFLQRDEKQFRENENNENAFKDGQTYLYNGFVPYNLQVADINGDGVQTVFYKVLNCFNDGKFMKDNTVGDYFSLPKGHHLVAESTYGTSSDGPKIDRGVYTDVDNPPVFAVLNTDDDTSCAHYTGNHYVAYSDPVVLAVMSSPPYFKDLMTASGLEGEYAESTTSYGTSKGSETSQSGSKTISLGMSESFEQEFSILGVKISDIETQFEQNFGVTEEYEKAKSVSYSVEYSTSSGTDAVVLFSVPTEVYEYETIYRDKATGTKAKYKKAMYFPKNPCITTIDIEKYNRIAETYSELPKIDKRILSHTLGYPETYPKSTGRYKNVNVFNGSWMGVGKGGSITQSQSIEMEKSEGTSYEESFEMSFSISSGVGGMKFGVSGGEETAKGKGETSTSGSSFGAEIANLPDYAEDYGYGMSWKLFTHEGSYTDGNGQTVRFPVVDYLVSDVVRPPSIPENLSQDYEASTKDSIVIGWEYDEPAKAEKFNIYRVIKVNGRESQMLVNTVNTGMGVKNDRGTYEYTYIDDGSNEDGTKTILKPGLEYEYYIEAVRSPYNPPSLSVPSERLTAYTNSDTEYPEIALSGINGSKLTIFPDRTYSIKADVTNKDRFTQLSYKWQKYDPKKGWINTGRGASLDFDEASMDAAGEYRCRVEAIFYNETLEKLSAVSACTDIITIDFKMRSVIAETFTVTGTDTGISDAYVVLKPSNASCFSTPGGNVQFVFESEDMTVSRQVPLKAESGLRASARLTDVDSIPLLKDGNYKVSVYYAGDNVFGSFTSRAENLVIGDAAISPILKNAQGKITNSFTYGETMYIDFYRYTRGTDGHTTEEKLTDLTNQGGYSRKILDEPKSYTDQEITVNLEGVGSKTFTYGYTVTKRPLTIGVTGTELRVGDVEGKLPKAEIIEGSVVDKTHTPDQLASLTFKASEGGSTIELNNTTPVGTYYALLTAKDNDIAKCYELELQSAEIKVQSKVYAVDIEAVPYEGKKAGTISMTSPDMISDITREIRAYENGAKIKLTANPVPGYRFDHWEISEDGYVTTSEKQTVSRILYPIPMSFKAVFEPYTFKVTVDTSLNEGGTVDLPSGFVNGGSYAVGTEFTFVAKADGELIPDHWIKRVGRKSYYIIGDTLNLTVPEDEVVLYPVFVGRPCKITLGSGFVATYTYEEDVEVTKRIKSGDEIPKNSLIKLSISTGAEQYTWYVNGKEIGRNADAEFTITEDSTVELKAYERKAKPEAVFSATGTESGTLNNVESGMKYSLDGKATWIDITDTSVDIASGVTVDNGIYVYNPSDGVEILDSEEQYIMIEKADAPALSGTSPEVIGGKGSIPTTVIHQISTDGTTWTDCHGTSIGLEVGITYFVRVKPVGTRLASTAQEITIAEFTGTPEATPAATFTATGYDTATLSGLESGAQYAISGAKPEVFTLGDTATSFELANVEPGTLSIVRKGDGVKTLDSVAQEITVTRADAPNPTKYDSPDQYEHGMIENVDNRHEYRRSNDSDWTRVSQIRFSCSLGTYYVRIRAEGTVLASESVRVDILNNPQSNKAVAPVFNPPEGTYTEAQTVEISSTTPGSHIDYSINGNAPVLYTGPITVNENTTIKATAVGGEGITMNSFEVTATYTIVRPTYNVAVENGTSSAALVTAGTDFTVTANGAPEGKQFKEWEATGIELLDAQKKSRTLTINMPDNDVMFTAVYEDIPTYELEIYAPSFENATEGYDQIEAKGITITNAGNHAVTISSVALDRMGANYFTITQGAGTVEAGTTDTSYTIKPYEGLQAGTYNARIMATYDGGRTVTADVSFTVGTRVIESHKVTVTDDGNGTASASAVSVDPGTEVRLSSYPNEGYHFKEWQVVSGDVSITDNKFKMGYEDVVIRAIFESDEPHEHVYISEIAKKPTCTGKGIRVFTCKCGDSYKEEIAPLGHEYKSEVTKEPTTTEEGIRTYTCIRCGDSYTEKIEKLNGAFLLYEKTKDGEKQLSLKRLNVGGSFTLIPIFESGKVVNERVVWSSSSPDVASVTQAGKISAISGGETRIMVRSEADPQLYAYCYVYVTEPVTEVTLDKKNYSFGKGESFTLTATVLPFNAKQELKWTSSTENVSIKVSNDTLSAVITGVNAGNAKVTAAATDGSGKKAACSVTVGNPVPDFTITGKNGTTEVEAGKTLTMQVVWSDSKPKNSAVTWAIEGANAQYIASINEKGVLTGITAGKVTVTATSKANRNKKASAVVTVKAPAASNGPKITAISFTNVANLKAKGLNTGKGFSIKTKLTLDGKGSAGSNAVAWISSDSSVATVNQKGAVKAVAPGEVTISAVPRNASDLSSAPKATVTFKVYSMVKSVKLDKKKLTIGTQPGTQFAKVSIASVLPANATDPSMEWTVNSKNVQLAAVDKYDSASAGDFYKAQAGASITTQSGEAVAIKALLPGVVKLTGITKDGSKKRVTCTITVRGQVSKLSLMTLPGKNGVNNVTLSDNEVTINTIEYKSTMKENSSLKLTPLFEINGVSNTGSYKKTYASYKRYTDLGMSYRSSDTNVATVDKNGKIKVQKKAESGKTATIYGVTADGLRSVEVLVTVK